MTVAVARRVKPEPNTWTPVVVLLILRFGPDAAADAATAKLPRQTTNARIADDNPVIRILVKNGSVVTAVTSTDGRKITAETLAIAIARDKCCANPDYKSTFNIQLDHRRPVRDNGPPTLGNLIGLCSKCHYRKTHLGWCLVGPRDNWRFVKRRATGDGGIGYPLDHDEDPGDYLG